RQILVVGISVLVFVICAIGWFAFWFITDAHYRWIWFGWRESMAQENARHPVTLQSLRPYLGYFFVSAPLVLLSLPFALWNAIKNDRRERKLSPLLLLAAMGLLSDLLFYFNSSTAVNWRYFLTVLPAIAPLCADFLIRVLTRRLGSIRLAFAAFVLVILALAPDFV